MKSREIRILLVISHGIVVYDQEELTSIYTENVVSITHIGAILNMRIRHLNSS